MTGCKLLYIYAVLVNALFYNEIVTSSLVIKLGRDAILLFVLPHTGFSMSYCHHLASVVRRRLFTFSSFYWEPLNRNNQTWLRCSLWDPTQGVLLCCKFVKKKTLPPWDFKNSDWSIFKNRLKNGWSDLNEIWYICSYEGP